MNEDKVIEKLLNHDNEFVAVRKEIGDFRAEYLRGQDQIMKILIRLDEERIFTREAIRRMQEELDEQKTITGRHEILLNRVKLHLNIA